MKKLSLILALVAILSLSLTLFACGGNKNDTGSGDAAVSEVGKTYAVKSYKTDVNFEWDNPESAREVTDADRIAYSTIRISFKEDRAVEIFLSAEMPADDAHFYAVNSENFVEFFDSKEDAESMTNKKTDDYFGWNYKFGSDKKTLTVTIHFPEDGVNLKIVLTQLS